MWFQLFIEVLLRMHHKSSDRKELLDLCKKDYEGNQQEMSIIDEFEKNYKPEDAIQWYTRDSCFHRILNKALRVQDFDKLFALRFFITDIAKQIKNGYKKFIRISDTRNIFCVYRGQVIGNDELELMKNSIGEFLSMNSFLSTSRSRSTALDFARSTRITDGLQRIIFEIGIDPGMHTKAFADITQTSYFQNEFEVLIMLGALFRIEKVIEDKNDGVWVAHVSLASEDDYKLKETFSYMKSTIEDNTDWDSLGKILIEMDQYEQAEKCYRRMLDEIKLLEGNAKYGLGRTYLGLEEVDESLEYLLKALEIRMSVLGEYHADVGECYNSIGMAYLRARNEHENALSHLKKAVEIQEKILSSDSIVLFKTYLNIATAYNEIGKNDLALTYFDKASKIGQKKLPSDHPDVAAICKGFGDLCVGEKDYSKALEHYQKSLEISRKTLPPDHPSILGMGTGILYVKEKMNKDSNNSIK
jgi:tetratricopeptide (TPR) repeat protein